MSDTDRSDDARRQSQRARDRAAVLRVRDGDPAAFGELFDDWYDRIVDLAQSICRDQSAAEDVAQETFLAAWQRLDRLEDPASFGGWILRIARNGSYDRTKRDGRSTSVDDQAMAVMEATNAIPSAGPPGLTAEDRLGREADPEIAATDGELVALVWDAASALGERDRDVLNLRLRHNLAPADIAEVLGIKRNAANQLVHRVKQRLDTAVQARVLWRGAQVECTTLERELRTRDITSFNSEAVAAVDRHAETCEQCSERRRLRLQPSAMFSAIPILAVPLLSKQRAAAELASHGVPMDGSAARQPGSGDAGHGGSGGELPQSAVTAPLDDPSATGDVDAGAAPAPPTRRRRWRLLPAAFILVAVPLAVLAWAEHAGDRSVTTERATGTTEVTEPPNVGVRVAPGAAPLASGELIDPTIPSPEQPSTPSSTIQPPVVTSTTTSTTTVPAPASLEVELSERSTSDFQRLYAPGDVQSHDFVGSPVVLGATQIDPAPRIRWRSLTPTDAAGWTVRVSGTDDVLLASGPLEGSLGLCPGLVLSGGCELRPGSYDYTVELLDSTTAVRAAETVTFAVT